MQYIKLDQDYFTHSIETLGPRLLLNEAKANGGIKALEILRQEKVDVVFLDLMMPDMYGLNVLQEMKRDPNLSNIPVILQSGTSDEAEIHKAYDMGILSYIKKPYNKNLIMLELIKVFPKLKAA